MLRRAPRRIGPPDSHLRHGRLSAARTQDAGFTLVEVIVAIGLFTVVATSSTYAVVNLIKLSNITQDRILAVNLARQEIDNLRLQNSTGHVLVSAVTAPAPFTVTPLMSPSPTDPCPTQQDPFRRVTVLVSWVGTPQRSIRVDTVLAC